MSLASLRDKMEDLVTNLVVTDISPEVTKETVDAAVALGAWFSRCFKMTLNAREEVHKFWKERSQISTLPAHNVAGVTKLISPTVALLSNPYATLMKLAKKWSFKAFSQDPYTTVDEIRAAQLDINVLTMMGFLVCDEKTIELAKYAASSENYVCAGSCFLPATGIDIDRPEQTLAIGIRLHGSFCLLDARSSWFIQRRVELCSKDGLAHGP